MGSQRDIVLGGKGTSPVLILEKGFVYACKDHSYTYDVFSPPGRLVVLAFHRSHPQKRIMPL